MHFEILDIFDSYMTDATIKSWVSEVLLAAGLSRPLTYSVWEAGPDKCQAVLMTMSAKGEAGADSRGLLSTAASSQRKRATFVNSIPALGPACDLDTVFKWVKAISQSRFRPLRAAMVLCSMHAVERLLVSVAAMADRGSSANKSVYVFCGKVSQQIAMTRCRDTAPVIRQIVGEYFVRWVTVSREVLSSSVFSKKQELADSLFKLLCDEDGDVRSTVIAGLSSLYSETSFSPIKVSNVQLPMNLLLIKAHELSELLEVGNPPYLELLRGEIAALASLMATMVKSHQSVLDGLAHTDLVYQLVWDRYLPIEARIVVASIVSQNVLGSDILDSRFTDFSKGIEILMAFLAQYNPYNSGNACHGPMFESFFSGMQRGVQQGFLTASLSSLLDEKNLVRANCLMEIVETLVLVSTKAGSSLRLELDILADKIKDESDPVALLNAVLVYSQSAHFEGGDLLRMVSALEAVLSRSASTPYRTLHIAYQVWDRLARESFAVRDALDLWFNALSTHLTVSTLTSIHASEAALQRPLANLQSMARLIDFVLAGEIQSVQLVVCSLDLVFMQTLKPHAPSDAVEFQSLKEKLISALQFLHQEASRDFTTGSQQANVLKFFCQYRLAEFDDCNPRKEKGSIAVESSIANTRTRTLNEFILGELIDTGKLSEGVMGLESYTLRE